MRQIGIVVVMVMAPLAAEAQTIRAVELGVTHISEISRIRGTPDREGLTDDGRTRFLRYGEYAFYFGRDSVAKFARVFPEAMTRAELEGVFGKPISETHTPDLNINALYSDTVMARIDRGGNLVIYIEYARRSPPLVTPAALADARWVVFLDTIPTNGRLLRFGSLVHGQLTALDVMGTDGSFYQPWRLDGTVGDTVTVDLLSSEFDAYLWITGPGLFQALGNDDGAGGCNARLTFRFTATGAFRVIVSSYDKGRGRFTLRVSRVPNPVTPRECRLP